MNDTYLPVWLWLPLLMFGLAAGWAIFCNRGMR